jgi:acetylornithine aminotransferase
VANALREAGFLANPVQPGVLRLAPPLILDAGQVDAFLAALPAALDVAAGTEPSPADVALSATSSELTP